MRKGITRHKLIIIHLLEPSSISTCLTSELVFLVIGQFVENAHPIICSPAKKQVFVGIDLRTFISGLLERCKEYYILLGRSLNVYLSSGAGCENRNCQSKNKRTFHISFVLFTNQYPDHRHHRWARGSR